MSDHSEYGSDIDLRMKKGLILIGDTHGDRQAHRKGVYRAGEKDYASLHLGDVNMGDDAYDYFDSLGPYDYCLRGNHENHPKAIHNPHFLSHYGVIQLPNGRNGFYLSGAYSVDKVFRTPGFDWFHNEELTFSELLKAYKLYMEVKPEVLFSHEGARQAIDILGLKGLNLGIPFQINSPTSQTLDLMLNFHKPEEVYFGHWHTAASKKKEGTYYSCLGINEIKEIVF